MELRWLVSQPASCLHAVAAMDRQLIFADQRMGEQLAPSVAQLQQTIQAADLPKQRLLETLAALAAGIPNPRDLIETVIRKLGCGEIDHYREQSILLGGLIVDIQNAVKRLYPNLVDELALRSGPIREQWESRGPGLLKAIARMTDARLLVPNAEVILVHPVLGGGGAAHLLYNSVRLEAVLINPEPQLPEIVRLAWLLAQLNVDLPMFSEGIRPDRLASIASLALIPPTLAAAEFVELATFDLPTIELAIRTWRPLIPNENEGHDTLQPNVMELAETLMNWWQTFLDSQPPWGVALVALDEMFQA